MIVASAPRAGARGLRAGEESAATARRDAALIWVLSLAMLVASALLFRQPGYMDAYYYYHVAANLAQGRGLVEDFVWNYLPAPQNVTHASNLYWMPLTSLVLAPFLRLLGESFRAAQVPMVVLASLAPVLAYALGRDLFVGRRCAVGMAALTLFGGYYFVYWTALDSFGLFTLAANLALFCMYRTFTPTLPPRFAWAAAVGLFTALAHLARADGVLLLAAFAAALALAAWPAGGSLVSRMRLPAALLAVALAAYVLAMSPWFLRNWLLVGSPVPSAGLKTLFLREYNDFYGYGLDLTLRSFLDWGVPNILWSKLMALGRSLLVLFGMEYQLVPLAALGVWVVRRDRRHWPFLIYGVMLYLAMSLLFTFPAARGSMLHSAAVLLPWTAGAAIKGLDRAVEWVAQRLRHWNVPLARRNFTAILILFSAGASVFLLVQKASTWDERYWQYEEMAAWFAANAPGDMVMVVDPPGYFYSSHHPSVVIPSDGPEAALEVARRYGVSYLALEKVHAQPFKALYRGEVVVPGLERAGSVGDTQIYRLQPEPH